MAQMARLVEAAQSGKAPVQRLADRVSAVFVPAVIALSVVTLGVWLGLGPARRGIHRRGCRADHRLPVPLGSATRRPCWWGTSRGAQLGILIKGPEILESTRRVDTVVLDKTGTITTGRMRLVDVVPADRADGGELLRLAGALEKASEHPIGRAIADGAGERLGEPPWSTAGSQRRAWACMVSSTAAVAPVARRGWRGNGRSHWMSA